MRTIYELPANIMLYDTQKHGEGIIGNITERVGNTWVSSIRYRGGFYVATCEYKGTRDDMLEMFLEGMARVIQLEAPDVCWRGFAAEFALTLDGVTLERLWSRIKNRVKVIYTRLGDNLITNPSVESTAWTSLGTPTTNERSTTWRTHGNYSDHVVTNAAAEGVTIQSSATISAGVNYDCYIATNIISGTWVLSIYRTDTSAIIASITETETGQKTLSCRIQDSNTYAGAVGVKLACTTSSGEIYADNAVLQKAPAKAETSWYEDTESQDEYGVLEEIYLEAGLTDAAANALAQTRLAKYAWPHTEPPNKVTGDAPEAETKLEITFYGDCFQLLNTYVTSTSGTNAASDHVTDVIGESEFITAGVIESNSIDYQIDEREQYRLWELLDDITAAGDSSGNLWKCGIFDGAGLYYGRALRASDSIQYQISGGRVAYLGGGEIDPWNAQPGYAKILDLPGGPEQVSGSALDDPRVIYLQEIECDLGAWLKGKSGLSFRRMEDE